MADIYKFAQSWMNAWVRSGPGKSHSQVRVESASSGKEYTVTDRQNSWWLKIGEGQWICEKDGSGNTILVKVRTDSAQTVSPDQAQSSAALTTIDEESYGYIPEDDLNIEVSQEDFESSLNSNFKIANLRGIFGMPYQFMPNADPRVDGSISGDSIGRKYAKEIVTRMPLLLITPGLPRFMSNYNNKEKRTILETFVQGALKNDEDNIADIITSKNFGKYYSLEYAYNQYYQYVNPMCRVAARLLNLNNIKVDGVALDSYNWAGKTNENFNKLFSVYRGCTAWYCSPEPTINDSFGNSTTESQLASKVNGLSEYGRELQFLLGTTKSYTGADLDAFTSIEGIGSSMEDVNNFIDNILGGTSSIGGIFKSLSNSIHTIVAGGKIVFPEIWAESSFDRSYEVTIKLVSPDADDLSLYLNIIVPMLHLLGLVLPRETAAGGHGYISPFLVRAYHKGQFNVDMGIITSMSFSKGKESAWSISGIPSVVDVTFTIKDLYSDMYMTDMSSMRHNMMNNIILMDYISTLCGININEPDILRTIDLYWTQNIVNRVRDTWSIKIWGSLDQAVANTYQRIFGKF